MKRALLAFNMAMAVFILAPLAVIIWMSFTPSSKFDVPIGEWSLRWYGEILSSPAWIDAFQLSLILASFTSVVVAILGFLAAYGIVRYRLPGSLFLEGFFLSPIIIPAVAFGVAFLQTLIGLGVYDSFVALLVAHVVFVSPFAVRTSIVALKDVPEELELAARNMGASRTTVLTRITLPLSSKGIIAGAVFAFIISFDEVTISLFVTGPTHQTLPIRIYNYLFDQIDPSIASLSAMLVVLSLVAMLLLERLMGLKRILGN